MAQSPYSPPAAPVGDPPEPQHAFPKPRQVSIAVACLWWSLALAVPSLYFEGQRLESTGELIFFAAIMLLVFGFVAYLNVKISQGRNWARWLFLVLVVVGVASFLIPDDSNRAVSLVESGLTVVSFVLDGVALYLLFSWPGALWFRPRE